MAYQDADREPFSTTVSNRLRVAFITDCCFYEGGASKDGKSDSWPRISESSCSVGPLISLGTNMPRDPVTGDCSAALVRNSQLLVDGRQQLDVVFRRVVMEGVQ